MYFSGGFHIQQLHFQDAVVFFPMAPSAPRAQRYARENWKTLEPKGAANGFCHVWWIIPSHKFGSLASLGLVCFVRSEMINQYMELPSTTSTKRGHWPFREKTRVRFIQKDMRYWILEIKDKTNHNLKSPWCHSCISRIQKYSSICKHGIYLSQHFPDMSTCSHFQQCSRRHKLSSSYN